ncbi:hypothetical protein I4U23_017382 [Adineta vaga]|nr:hypothetical protein I4U23_017382 [Adineta vaga]
MQIHCTQFNNDPDFYPLAWKNNVPYKGGSLVSANSIACGTNDLADGKRGEEIFHQGLKLMYEMILNYNKKKSHLALMTIIENGFYSPNDQDDQQRQILNELIRNYIENSKEKERI